MENNKNPIIQLRDVHKAYATGDGPFLALKEINLEVKAGEFLGITGKSGAGKTTLLNIISGVSQLTSGEVLYFSSNNGAGTSLVLIHELDEDKLALWRGENMGIIYQSFELMPTLNLVENVMLPPDFLNGYDPIGTKTRALELLDLVGIGEHAYKIPAHISGGQKQRVAIARALVNDPPLIIADEPTGNLDTVTAETIFQIFEKLVEQGKSIVMVTHDESFSPRFTRQLRIVDGEVRLPLKNSAALVHAVQANEDVELFETNIDSEAKKELQNKSAVAVPCDKLIETYPEKREEKPMIILRGVDKVYENAAGKFVALKSIDLQLNAGQFISIVGKSGSGKSTLLNMITGIDHPTTGEVIINNEHIYGMSESQRALWRGKNMGVVFQFFQLLPTLTLLENTMLPMDYCNTYEFNERPARAMELLRMVGLGDQAYKLPVAVSSGQQQSAAIARSLATDPAIILADEPTGNLDSKTADKILNIFENLAEQGKTILIVTHDPSITQRTDRTVILSDGEIIDQAVARALPYLSHPQMLAATKQAKTQIISSNSTILSQGEKVDHFFMIQSGQVEIVAVYEQSNEMALACLGPGQFFGEVELTLGGNSMAKVRAGYGGAEIALLAKDDFYQLIDDSPLTRKTIEEVAHSRMSENKRRKKAAR